MPLIVNTKWMIVSDFVGFHLHRRLAVLVFYCYDPKRTLIFFLCPSSFVGLLRRCRCICNHRSSHSQSIFDFFPIQRIHSSYVQS
ncbi:hypothetical protein Dimus_039280 [Dionaea muscipula]